LKVRPTLVDASVNHSVQLYEWALQIFESGVRSLEHGLDCKINKSTTKTYVLAFILHAYIVKMKGV
jgi:hypothetical protein